MAEREKRIPLVAEPGNRDTSTGKDARLINGYIERKRDERELWVYKRPCLLTAATWASGQTGRGCFNWRGDIYAVFGNVLYKNAVSHGTGLNTAGGHYTFSACLGGTPRLFLHNGAAAYTTDGTTFAQVTDVDFPATLVKGSVYLDGTTYVMNSEANIRGSDINDPTSWDALNSLIAQVEPDRGIFLAKQLVYVIAFKEWSTEVFYDKANATGSPLAPVQGAKANYGCRAGTSVQDIDGVLYWISTTREAGVGVHKLEGLKGVQVSTPAVERLLQSLDYTSTVWSWSFHLNGHKFYGVSLPLHNLTLVYDTVENEWAQWTDTSGNYWPICDMTFDSSQRVLAQHATDGKMYYVDAGTYQDNAQDISFELITPTWDAESTNRKYVNRLTVVGDKQSSGTLDIRVSDDDYQTWSAYRSFDLTQNRPFTQDWATFTRRAHHLRHRHNGPLRLQALEMDWWPGVL